MEIYKQSCKCWLLINWGEKCVCCVDHVGFDDGFCKKCHLEVTLCDCKSDSMLIIHISNTLIFYWVGSEVVLVRILHLREVHWLKVEEAIDVCEVRFICTYKRKLYFFLLICVDNIVADVVPMHFNKHVHFLKYTFFVVYGNTRPSVTSVSVVWSYGGYMQSKGKRGKEIWLKKKYGIGSMTFKLSTLCEISHSYLTLMRCIPCINHQTNFWKQTKKMVKIFIDKEISLNPSNIFFISPGITPGEFQDVYLHSDSDCCYVLDKCLIVKVKLFYIIC